MNRVLYVFHIEHPSGEPMLLHPFHSDKDILEKLDSHQVKGLYGKDPRVETITLLRNVLYRKVEHAVNSWLKEKRFLVKFLISSGLFLLTYLLLTLILRDPIPLVDELLIALAVSIVMYFYMTRRDSSSEPAAKKRVKLRGKVDNIRFDFHPVLEQIERYLTEHKPVSNSEAAGYVLDNILSEKDGDAEKQLKTYFEEMLKEKPIRS